MRKLLALLMLAAFGLGASVRFATLADIHFGDTAYFEADEPAHNLRFIQTNFTPDFVLNIGDCTLDGSITAQYAGISNCLATNITCPVWSVPGNHDESILSVGMPKWGQYFGATNVVFTNVNYKFIGFWSRLQFPNQFTNYDGQVDSTTLDWLLLQLTNSNHRKVVFTHFPALGNQWTIQPGYGLEALTNMLVTNNVALYLYGHTHYESNETQVIHGVTRQIAMPSLDNGKYFDFKGQFNVCVLATNILTLTMYQASVSNNYPVKRTDQFNVPWYGLDVPTIRGAAR